jgi:hypothetical protein
MARRRSNPSAVEPSPVVSLRAFFYIHLARGIKAVVSKSRCKLYGRARLG